MNKNLNQNQNQNMFLIERFEQIKMIKKRIILICTNLSFKKHIFYSLIAMGIRILILLIKIAHDMCLHACSQCAHLLF